MSAFSLAKSNVSADYPMRMFLAYRSRDPHFDLKCAFGGALVRTDQLHGAIGFPRALTSSILSRSG
jgi:hypothetical protein